MKDDARIASLLLGCGLLFLVQCDTFKPGDPDRPLSLTPADVATLTVNALDIRLDSSGAVLGISQPGTSVRLVSDAGVWLAGVQDGEVRAVVREFSRSNYGARAAERRLGVFSLTPDSLIGTHLRAQPQFHTFDEEVRPAV